MPKPTTALALAAGYTKAVFATSLQYDLELLVQPTDDLGERFRAFDMDSNEWLWVNGWMFDIEPDLSVGAHLAPIMVTLGIVDAQLRAYA